MDHNLNKVVIFANSLLATHAYGQQEDYENTVEARELKGSDCGDDGCEQASPVVIVLLICLVAFILIGGFTYGCYKKRQKKKLEKEAKDKAAMEAANKKEKKKKKKKNQVTDLEISESAQSSSVSGVSVAESIMDSSSCPENSSNADDS